MVVLGRLADPYGIRGWLHLHAYGDDPLSWSAMPSLWLEGEAGQWHETGLQRLKMHGDGVVVLLDGVPDRSAAEKLKGRLLAAPRDALPVTSEDEFYWADLIGLSVVNTAGESLGKVVGLIETGANSVLRVEAPDREERLLPFVASVVLKVDQAAGRIEVDWNSDW